MTQTITDLHWSELDQLVGHEEVEPDRLERIVSEIRGAGYLSEPVSVTPLGSRWLILDGAHRVASLRRLGCRRVPLQIANNGEWELGGWFHAIPERLWTENLIGTGEKKEWEESGIQIETWTDRRIIRLGWTGKEPDMTGLQKWRYWVTSYMRLCSVRRIPDDQPPIPRSGEWCILHPVLDWTLIRNAVEKGEVFPAGVTRFHFPDRVTGLEIPLEELGY